MTDILLFILILKEHGMGLLVILDLKLSFYHTNFGLVDAPLVELLQTVSLCGGLMPN